VIQKTKVVMGRRRIRAYKPEPVPREVLEEVIALAVRSPSSMNTPPWRLQVLGGEALDKVRRRNTERNLTGVAPSREIRSHGAYQGAHRKRQIDVAVQLFQAMGYPDASFPANAVMGESSRGDSNHRSTWLGARQNSRQPSSVPTSNQARYGDAIPRPSSESLFVETSDA